MDRDLSLMVAPPDLGSTPTDDSAPATSAVIEPDDASRFLGAAVEDDESPDRARRTDDPDAAVELSFAAAQELSSAAPVDAGAVSSARPVDVSASQAVSNAPVVSNVTSAAPGALGDLFDQVILVIRRTLFNQAPTVDPVQLSGQAGGLITGTVGAVDPEQDPITFSLAEAPQNGDVTLTPGGGYTYIPGPDFHGVDTFTVTATDTGFHINLLDLFRPGSTSAVLEVTQSAASSGLTFNFIYGTGSQYWSAEARDALQSAARLLSSYIVVESPVVIDYDVSGEDTSTLTLASAGSDLASAGPGFSPTVVQKKILSGVDANGADPDGHITFNFGRSWALGSSVAVGQYDFQSAAMHELMHSLGVFSYVDSAGSNTGQSWSTFDSFIVTGDDVEVIGPDGSWNTAYDPNLTGADGGLYFGGANAVDAFGGLVPLYTPTTWRPGSSVTHLEDSTFSGANKQLMNAVAGSGPGVRVLSPIELGILEDLGYTLNSPQDTIAMLLIAIPFFRPRRTDSREQC